MKDAWLNRLERSGWRFRVPVWPTRRSRRNRDGPAPGIDAAGGRRWRPMSDDVEGVEDRTATRIEARYGCLLPGPDRVGEGIRPPPAFRRCYIRFAPGGSAKGLAALRPARRSRGSGRRPARRTPPPASRPSCRPEGLPARPGSSPGFMSPRKSTSFAGGMVADDRAVDGADPPPRKDTGAAPASPPSPRGSCARNSLPTKAGGARKRACRAASRAAASGRRPHCIGHRLQEVERGLLVVVGRRSKAATRAGAALGQRRVEWWPLSVAAWDRHSRTSRASRSSAAADRRGIGRVGPARGRRPWRPWRGAAPCGRRGERVDRRCRRGFGAGRSGGDRGTRGGGDVGVQGQSRVHRGRGASGAGGPGPAGVLIPLPPPARPAATRRLRPACVTD